MRKRFRRKTIVEGGGLGEIRHFMGCRDLLIEMDGSASTHARPLSVVAGALLAEYAIRVFDKICEHGITPNLKTFETLIWGFAEAKHPWKAEEILQIMTEFEVQREKSTMLLVTEAWRATGMTKEASGTLGTINKMEMSCQKEIWKNKYRLEKAYRKAKQRVSSIPISCGTQVREKARDGL
ncbi:hypothetical protein OIU76_008871 [Salix suchowensis]|nr:hypothetical protein OIU76_008871 [Salix suchowensis]